MPVFPISIPESEENQAKELVDAIAGRKSATIIVGERSYELGESVCRLLVDLLKVTQESRSIAVVPELEELSTIEAAELLKVSRQYLVRLLDNGKIPCHKVGTHRRLYCKDLVEYKLKRESPRRRTDEHSPQYLLDFV